MFQSRDVSSLQLHLDNARPGCQTPESMRTDSDFQALRPKGHSEQREYRNLLFRIIRRREKGKRKRAPGAGCQGPGAWNIFLSHRRMQRISATYFFTPPRSQIYLRNQPPKANRDCIAIKSLPKNDDVSSGTGREKRLRHCELKNNLERKFTM